MISKVGSDPYYYERDRERVVLVEESMFYIRF